LTLQRELPKNTVLTVGYVGSQGVHLLAFHDFNAPVPTTTNGVMSFVHPDAVTPGQLDQNARPDPVFGALDMTDTSSHSTYNALQVGLQHRLSSNFVFQFSYTYSHCIDSAYTYGGLGFNNTSSAITNPYDWNNDRGNCSFDLRHNITGNVVWVLPFKGNRFKEGWQLTAIQAWHTGIPFSLGEGDQADLGNNFDNVRPNLVSNCDVYANQNVHQWYNPACFAASPYGTIGNLGRNILYGPGFVNTDFGLLKNTKINERMTLQFRAELFNIFNHPNFNFPATGAFNAGSIFTNYRATPNPTAGQITSLVGTAVTGAARQTQFSLKLLF
jgi:hypothetical protein